AVFQLPIPATSLTFICPLNPCLYPSLSSHTLTTTFSCRYVSFLPKTLVTSFAASPSACSPRISDTVTCLLDGVKSIPKVPAPSINIEPSSTSTLSSTVCCHSLTLARYGATSSSSAVNVIDWPPN